MSAVFLENLTQAIKRITLAQRFVAVDDGLTVVYTLDLEPGLLESEDFIDLVRECTSKALAQGDVFMTNDIIRDPAQAPDTNTDLTHMRIAIGLPVVGHGAIYVDQRIRSGVFPKQMLDRLMSLVRYIQENDLEHLDATEIAQLYRQVSLS